MILTMATVTTAISDIFTSVIAMVGEVATLVLATPLFLFFVLLSVVGLGIGMFKRIISLRS